jgi:hypothetical protein
MSASKETYEIALTSRPIRPAQPLLSQDAPLIGREVPEALAQLHAPLGRQHAVTSINVEQPRSLFRRQSTKLLVTLAHGRALIVGQASPHLEAVAGLRALAAIHFEPARSTARDLLLARRRKLIPGLLAGREHSALRFAEVVPSDLGVRRVRKRQLGDA